MTQIKKNIITVNEKNVEYAIRGTKGPTIILINGAGGPIEGWVRIWNQIGNDNIIFAYNRLGIGNSSKPSVPQTGMVMVKDLKELLHRLQLEPPYLVVGHSLGGFIAHLFTTTYPSEVYGVIFIESSTIKDVLTNSKRTKETDSNKFLEVNHVLTTTKQIQEARTFPNIPVTVIAGTKPAFGWIMPRKIKEERLNNQKELVNLTDKGRLILARKSGHFPQLTEPAVVVAEIDNILHEIYKG
jgi:pimeloyl-ACP methyl ester carboxylesterase